MIVLSAELYLAPVFLFVVEVVSLGHAVNYTS